MERKALHPLLGWFIISFLHLPVTRYAASPATSSPATTSTENNESQSGTTSRSSVVNEKSERSCSHIQSGVCLLSPYPHHAVTACNDRDKANDWIQVSKDVQKYCPPQLQHSHRHEMRNVTRRKSSPGCDIRTTIASAGYVHLT